MRLYRRVASWAVGFFLLISFTSPYEQATQFAG